MFDPSLGVSAAPAERLQGWVRSFRDTWGFLNAQGFQGDLFIGLKANPQLTSLKQGDILDFEVRMDEKGKPEAVNAIVVGSQVSGPSEDLSSLAGAEDPTMALVQQCASQVQYTGNAAHGGFEPSGPAVRAEVDHLIGQTLTGRIKSFRDPWGFINSENFVG